MRRIGFLFLFGLLQLTLSTNGAAFSPLKFFASNSEPEIEFTEGKDYFSYQEPLAIKPSDQRILIQFFFDYDCRVCSYAQDILTLYEQTNLDSVKLEVYPVATEDLHYSAQVFYTLKAINEEDTSALLLFETAEKQRYTQLSKLNELRTWLAQQKVNVDTFNRAFYSLNVLREVWNAKKLTEDYGVFTFPYVVIDGRYVLTASTLYSDDYSFAVLDFLVDKLIKEKQK
ncbi:thiol:disulfide interchange protein DsbA/DsbL [Bisgaard Taxon 46]